ncbi:MAG: hypothetical protein K8H87_17305, partial [Pseudorhodoplanes sp.]|nr:hypothetical protein [Pseudorhodoplanes sp.]
MGGGLSRHAPGGIAKRISPIHRTTAAPDPGLRRRSRKSGFLPHLFPQQTGYVAIDPDHSVVCLSISSLSLFTLKPEIRPMSRLLFG